VIDQALPDTPTATAWGDVVVLTLPWIALAGWPLVATRRRGAGPVADLHLRMHRRDLGPAVVGAVVALACAAGLAELTQVIVGHDLSSNVGDAFDKAKGANPVPLVLFVVLVVVGAPVVEEIFFRGLLFGALEKRGTIIPVCVSWCTIGFAVFHLEPARLPILLATGLVLSLVRARTGSTAASATAHSLYNLPSGIALLTRVF
jgi:membrane protease YdiL (CAAX protease family)